MHRSRESIRWSVHWIAAITSLLIACGAPQSVGDDTVLLPAQPMRLRVPDGADPLLTAALPPDASLDVAYELAWRAAIDAGDMPFHPADALAGEELAGFVRYFTWQQSLLEGDVHHVAFVVVDEWTPSRIEQFTRFFVGMPARTPVRTGAPRFHIVSRYPVPFAVEYLFGNQWWGSLESELYVTLADAPIDPATAPATAQLVRSVLQNWGLSVPDDRRAVHALDSIRLLLPVPPPGEQWRPRGTFVALGLLLGDALMAEDSGLAWVAAEQSLATTFAVAVDGDPRLLLRPIDFALEAWGSPNLSPFADYADLANQRVAEAREAIH